MSERRDALDPQVEAVVDEIRRLGVPEWHAMSVDCARRVEDDLFTPDGEPDDDGIEYVRDLAFETSDVSVDFADATAAPDEIPVRVYRPAGDGPFPTLVYYHGGGWTLGTLDSIDGVCREFARRANCLVVSVDYRLAPEHPFPTAVDDAYATVEWVADHASAFDGDPTRLGVAGTSAGGNLAAVTALRAREMDGPTISHQTLLYPMISRAFDRDSYTENAEGYLLSTRDVRWFWEQYLRSPVDAYNPFAAPILAADLSDLPPATVVTAGYDPLRDEGVAYADRLADEGVAVEHRHYPGMVHGFLSLTDDVDAAEEAMTTVADDIRGQLGALDE
ncbi:alpha/beta hydrolase [Haloprofundus marisrubri]|uniref:Alpha/beta hydrolase n=1 Tax=Haloprofundus marisrubri TaxID=1514971 RepID=A0A0W1R9N3_9EURY|nr:alpha/beta hydrolase [Haloprofundus marisrubri]KTG10340.1 alpha/beta hydrolase [Haloprofundus marisrubri]